jgi:hypothetical protein
MDGRASKTAVRPGNQCHFHDRILTELGTSKVWPAEIAACGASCYPFGPGRSREPGYGKPEKQSEAATCRAEALARTTLRDVEFDDRPIFHLVRSRPVRRSLGEGGEAAPALISWPLACFGWLVRFKPGVNSLLNIAPAWFWRVQ